MKIILLCLITAGLVGCASTTNLQKNCKQVGGEYWECDHYPLIERQCERFK